MRVLQDRHPFPWKLKAGEVFDKDGTRIGDVDWLDEAITYHDALQSLRWSIDAAQEKLNRAIDESERREARTEPT